MTKRSSILSRRTFLGGGSAIAIALPFLEAMMPTRSARAGGMANPQRLMTFYVPCGINMQDWTPAESGAGYTVTRSKVMSSIRHVDAPSTNVSPGRDS